MTSEGTNFLCGRAPSACVRLSLLPNTPPLRVEVINGWPHIRPTCGHLTALALPLPAVNTIVNLPTLCF